MTDFMKHEFCEEGEKIYVKEGNRIFELKFDSALNVYRGVLVEENESSVPPAGKFTSKIPKALVGYDDIAVDADPVYLGISTRSIQFGRPAEKKSKALVKPLPSTSTNKKLVVIKEEEEDEEEEEESTADDDEEYEEDDEDYSCGGSPKKKVHVISDDDEEDTINEAEARPELKRSKTISKINLDDEDTVPYIGSPPKLARETSASYSLSPLQAATVEGETKIFPSPPPE
jgi:hypothetical protein